MYKQFITLKELPGIPVFTVLDCLALKTYGHTTKAGTPFIGKVEDYPDFFAPLLEEVDGFKVGDKVNVGQLKGILVKGLYKSKYGIVLVVDVNGLTKIFHEDYVVKVPTLPTTMEEVQKLVYCKGTDERYAKELAHSKLLKIADALNATSTKSTDLNECWYISREYGPGPNRYFITVRKGTILNSPMERLNFKTKELAQHVIEHFSDVLKQLI